MSPLAHPKGKTPSRSSNLRKGVFLRLSACQSLSLWERWHCEAMTERASPAGKSRCAAMGRLFVRAMLSLCQSCLAASLPSQSGLRPPRPGCGSQRLLRCRSHPAGRGPNSSSLFPPLAAVVAVAPKGEPLACRPAFVWTSEAQYLGNSSAPLSSPAAA